MTPVAVFIPLTPMEEKVANCLTEGLTNQQIATELHISIKTVEAHLRHIFEKLDVRNRTQAALTWQKLKP